MPDPEDPIARAAREAVEGLTAENVAGLPEKAIRLAIKYCLDGRTPEEAMTWLKEVEQRIEARRMDEAANPRPSWQEKESTRLAAMKAKEAEWNGKYAFRWMLSPVTPIFNEETELVERMTICDREDMVMTIRTVALKWDGQGKMERWLWEWLGAFNMDWRMIVQMEDGHREEFMTGVRPAWMDGPTE